MGKLKASTSDKEQYGAYKATDRWATNKRRKLERHLRKLPNDEVAKKALAQIATNPNPNRKTPQSSVWTPRFINVAKMFASVGINGHHALMSDRVSQKIDDGEHLRFRDTDSGKRKNKTASA
jgi:hypothetical protein